MSRDVKYIGMDVHKEAIVIAVLNDGGKLAMESIIETKASTLLQFIHGVRGELHVTWEEGTWAAWLYDLLKPQVQQVLVCDPRRNALLKEGNKSDKVDARKLADLLRTGMLRPVYHGEHGQLQRSKKPQPIRGLNRNHNHEMKEIFKGAATRASCGVGPLRDFYVTLLDKGMKPEMARLTLARKIAAIALTLWKKEERFDAEELKTQAA